MTAAKPSKRAKSDWRMRAEAYAVGLVLFILRYLPHWATATLASLAARVMCVADARHRRIMIRQMRLAFGERFSEEDLRRLSRECYRHELLCFVELARLPRIGQKYLQRHIDSAAMAAGKSLKQSGKGVLIITGHIGSWELLAHTAALNGYPVTALARPLKNPYLNAILNRLRTVNGNQIREKLDSMRSISQLVKQGEWVCFLYDQNGGRNDAFIPFFGVPAATWRSAPFIHLKFDIPILVCSLMRENWRGDRFTAVLCDPLYPEESRLHDNPESYVLNYIHRGFEKAIAAHPEQWIWQHRRWKTRPQGESSQLVDGVPVFQEP